MNRRKFLSLSAAALAAGCRKEVPPPAPPLEPSITDDERARIERETETRHKFIGELKDYRAGTGEARKTPPPPKDIAEEIIELRTRRKMAIRLHPRYGDEPAPAESKLGGRFLWPDGEPWPTHEATLVPLTPVLQLAESEQWPPIQYRSGCDVMQLFWLARDPVEGELHARIVWRNIAQSRNRKLMEPPGTHLAFPSLTPVPCRLHPEWVMELPDWDTLQRTDLRAKLSEWTPPDGTEPREHYQKFLTSARGCKLGGWPRESLKAPACSTKSCQRAMDYLLTIDSSEWTPQTAARWRPVEEPDDALGRRGACGLSFAGGHAVEVFICRRCPEWPIRAMVVV